MSQHGSNNGTASVDDAPDIPHPPVPMSDFTIEGVTFEEVTRRLRISHVLVQPILVWDDGAELSPGPPTTAVMVPLSELAAHAERLRAELAAMQA